MIFSCKIDISFNKEDKMRDFFKKSSGKVFLFKEIGFEKDKVWPESFDPIRVEMILNSDHNYTDDKCILNFENFIEIPDYIKRSPKLNREAEIASKYLNKKIISGEEWMMKNWNCLSHPFIATFFYDYCGKEAEIYFTSKGGVPFPVAEKISEIEKCKVSLLWECLDNNRCGTDCWDSGNHIMNYEDDIQKDLDGEIVSHLS